MAEADADDAGPGPTGRSGERICFGEAEQDAWLGLTLASSPKDASAAVLRAALSLEGVEAGTLRVLDPKTGSLGVPMEHGPRPADVPDPCPRLQPGGAAFHALEAAEPGFLSCRAAAAPGAAACRGFVPLIDRGKALAGLCVFGGASALARDASLKLSALSRVGGIILARAQANAALADSEYRYRALLRQCPEGIYLFDPTTWRIEETNERLASMLGYLPDELVGRSIDDIVAHDPASIRENIHRVVATGEFAPGERRYRRKDGALVDVEVYASFVRFRDSDIVQAYVRDVSQRKKALAELQALRRRDELILESAGEGILGLDRAGRHVFVNRAASALLGYAPEELVGRPSHEVWHHTRKDGTPYPESECPIHAAFRDGKVHRVAGEVFFRPDGERFLAEFVSTPILEDGVPTGAVVVFRDVTHEARLESIAEAVETMNSIGYVFSAVRHELGNPVNSVKMALSVLRSNLVRFRPDQVESYVDRCLGELARVEYLLASLKSFSLYEDVQLEAVRLDALVEEFAAFLRTDFGGRGIAVEVSEAAPVVARVDRRALHQVLLNLAANAADAVAGGGEPRVTISCRREGDLAVVTVADNGVGMSEELRASLFQPFLTTKEAGTGLGLVLVKKMVSRMSGTVEVRSAPGRGTDVVLAFGAEPPV